MNGDALSDVLLSIVCGWIAARECRKRPGIAIAVTLMGIAAIFGVFRFSGFEWAVGPHAFSSTFAALAGTSLLAFSWSWPDDPIAQNASAASRFALILGALGIAAFVAELGWINLVLITGAILAIVWTSLRPLKIFGLGGAAFFVAGGIVGSPANAGVHYFGGLNHTQLMHILLAISLIMLTHRPGSLRTA